MRLYKTIIVLCTFSVFLFSCYEEDPIPVSSARTVLVYIAGDNSLNSYAYQNIEQMKQGLGSFNGNLVVYFDPVNDVPRLLAISKGANGKGQETIIQTYEEEDSASPEVLARVAEDVRRLFPANSYGLVLWSHGMGWLPADYYFPNAYATMSARRTLPPTKYFAEDQHPGSGNRSTYMKISDLASALPGGFQFILFDACFMASVEVAYELRNKTDYIISSPAEVIANGFPYDRIIPLMNGGEDNLKRICREFYDFYNSKPDQDWRSAMVSLIKTSELDGLASVTRSILEGKAGSFPVSKNSEVWRYILSPGLPKVFFDFGDYIRSVATPEQYAAFTAQCDKAVIYKLTTDTFFSVPVPAGKYSGLSSYIPYSDWANMNDAYTGMEWYKAVY